MAKLGVRSGRADWPPGSVEHRRRSDQQAGQGLNLSALLTQGNIPADEPRFCVTAGNPPFDKGLLAEQMVVDAKPALSARKPRCWSTRSATSTARSVRACPAKSPATRDGLPDGC